jgi:hypothetical protein
MSDFNAIRFLSGRPLLKELGADRLNTILTEIKRNKPKGERGITVRQDGTGTYIGLAAALPRGASTPTTPQPWDLIARVDPDADPEDENPPYLVTCAPAPSTASCQATGTSRRRWPGQGCFTPRRSFRPMGAQLQELLLKLTALHPLNKPHKSLALPQALSFFLVYFPKDKQEGLLATAASRCFRNYGLPPPPMSQWPPASCRGFSITICKPRNCILDNDPVAHNRCAQHNGVLVIFSKRQF